MDIYGLCISIVVAYLIVLLGLYIFQGETSENKSKKGQTIKSFTPNFSCKIYERELKARACISLTGMMCCLRAWDHGYGEGAGSLMSLLITDRPRHLQVLQKKTAHTLASLLKNADWAKTVHRHKADEAQWRHDPPRLGLAESNLHPRSTQQYPRKSVSGPLSGLVLLALRIIFLDVNCGLLEWNLKALWQCSDVHWALVCFRWQETINTTPNASCV